jgi:DNA helicase-2/ATP-dependent DNA helicase PcrA
VSLLAALNSEQRQAVTHEGGHCLVLAGAGSGKTRVLTHRIAYLIDSLAVPPEAICGLTFTNKAAAEMRERVVELLGEQPRGLLLSTFHAFGLRLLRESAGRARAPAPGFAVYDRDNALSVWRRCQRELRISPREYDPGRLFGRCSRAVNRLEDPASWDSSSHSWERRLAARTWTKYRAAMQAAGAVDFDDLLVLPLRLLSTDAELCAVMQERWQHFLVDEYQDTNRLQYRLLRTLLADNHELMVVGDEDQSIYRWRGADLNNVLDFQSDFPGASLIRLEQNYRSTQPILSAAGSLVAHNRQRLGKSLWTEQTEGEPPTFVQCATDRQEAEWVASRLSDAKSLADTAILYRTNAQSRLFEEVFLAHRIPHRVVGGPRFFARREVRDLLAYLVLVVRDDDVALRRAVAAPNRGIGSVTLQALTTADPAAGAAGTLRRLAAAPQPEQALRDIGCPAASIQPLLELHHLLQDLRRLAATVPLPELLRTVLARSGYARRVAQEPDADDRLANLEEIISAAGEISPGGNEASSSVLSSNAGDSASEDAPVASTSAAKEPLAGLAAFLDHIALLTDADSSRGSEEGVRLMTVHAAKGLEFERVFLVGMEEELFPHMTAIADGQLEEERRLCYVGMTRAMRSLYLSAARSRRVHGRERWQETSRFIHEIDPRFIIVRDNVAAVRDDTSAAGDLRERRRALARGSSRAKAVATRRASSSSGGGSTPRPGHVRPAQDEDLQEGVRVLHAKFGAGKIASRQGSGEKLKLVIRFTRAGTKTVLARYANLEVMG